MHSDDDEKDLKVYSVVVNHEEQYSIWPVDREIPNGWISSGKTGSREECLEYVKEVWTDMRPLSLRKHMEEMDRKRSAGELQQDDVSVLNEANDQPSLVERLVSGRHPVELSLRPDKTAAALKERIDSRYVLIKFTRTKGGTELGMELNFDACDLSKADFEKGAGTVHLEGALTLDSVSLRCIADIELETLAGQGHLVPVEPSETTTSPLP